jgi:tRNA modification GTPase
MVTVGSATIFAPATAPGRAALAIMRLSGSSAGDVCRRLTGRPPPAPRRAALRRIHDPQRREALDQGLVLWFPAPASFTGEDVLELQVHGGGGVLRALMDAMSEIPVCVRPSQASSRDARS